MEKVVWSGLYVCRKQSRGHAGSREVGSVKNAGVTPGRSLTKHRSNSVSFHTLFGDASKTGAQMAFGPKDSGAHYVYEVGTEERA